MGVANANPPFSVPCVYWHRLGNGVVPVELFQYNTAKSEMNRTTPDPYMIGAQLARYAQLPAAVPPGEVVGYISDLPAADSRSTVLFLGALPWRRAFWLMTIIRSGCSEISQLQLILARWELPSIWLWCATSATA